MKVAQHIVLCQLKLLFLVSLLVTAGCTTRLAPGYDEALYRGITETNVKIMELFALVSSGTDAITCGQRLDAYNAVIGSVDALSIQSKARPVPDSAVLERVNKHLVSRGMAPLTDQAAPSAAALENISAQLVRMKQVDCESGLTTSVIAIFRNAVIISMDQAITYESFLNR